MVLVLESMLTQISGTRWSRSDYKSRNIRHPPPALLERFHNDQRKAFLEMWELIPPHLQDIHFDLDGTQ